MRKFILIFYVLITGFLHAQVNTNDSLILVELFNATNGQNWLNKSNWLTGNVNTWYGITVANNRVTKISLSTNNLSGQIPNSICDLDTLLTLGLGGSANLNSTIPDSIGKLTNLKLLSLVNSATLYGEIPNSIGNLVNLTSISLGHCNLTGSIPESIGNLVNLTGFSAGFNQLTGMIPSTIGNMVSLNFLGLNNNQLQKDIPESICNLTNLTGILLYNNNLTGNIPSCFGANMPQLQDVKLSNNQLSGAVPASLVNCSQYLNLEIENNNFIDFPDLSSLGQWYTISAENNNLTFEDLEPNMICWTFSYGEGYIPQDSVLAPQALIARLDSSYTLSSTVGGTANHYQWFKNGDTLQGATDSILYFPFIAWADSGVYTCHITNDIVTGLTLYRYPITLNVSDTITSNSNIQYLNKNVIIYPNPASSRITIASKQFSVNGNKLLLYDLFGKEVFATEIKEQTIDISQVPQGVYVYRITDNKGVLKSGKLVVVK